MLRSLARFRARGFSVIAIPLIAAAIASPLLPADRPAAPWPPPSGGLRVIIDADTANEIDDQYALALALG